MAYFVLVNEQGPAWVSGRPMREQQLWSEHAAYVNDAMYAGSVILGGPIGDGEVHRAMLVLNADSLDSVRSWHAADPWVRAGILQMHSLEPWTLLVSNDKLDPVLADITRAGAAP